MAYDNLGLEISEELGIDDVNGKSVRVICPQSLTQETDGVITLA